MQPTVNTFIAEDLQITLADNFNSKVAMPSNLVAPPFKKAVQTDPPGLHLHVGLTEFFFYLDAWTYCWKHNIPLQRIQRKSWKVWHLVE